MKNKKIYLDYAASTPIDPRVIKIMVPLLKNNFGNSSSLHFFGRQAYDILEKSRKIVAQALNAVQSEIFFTSSATESNNTVLKGIASAYKKKGNHLVISSIEHDSIINCVKWLAKQGTAVSVIPVDKDGLIEPEQVKKAIRKDTILVSIMHANNEIGVIQPIEKIGRICRERQVLFHTDAAQSFGKIPLDVKRANIDLLTASSHKMYGPKGVALLYVKEGIKLEPLLHGGGHEKGLRSSTINVPLIASFAKAVSLCQKQMKQEATTLTRLRDKMIYTILKKIPHSFLNGHPSQRLPNNVNFRFLFVEGESIIMQLDKYGIAASTGSACSSKSLSPSHVLLALGLKSEEIHGSVRFSLGRWTTEKEIDYLLSVLPKIIKDLRIISPFFH